MNILALICEVIVILAISTFVFMNDVNFKSISLISNVLYVSELGIIIEEKKQTVSIQLYQKPFFFCCFAATFFSLNLVLLKYISFCVIDGILYSTAVNCSG